MIPLILLPAAAAHQRYRSLALSFLFQHPPLSKAVGSACPHAIFGIRSCQESSVRRMMDLKGKLALIVDQHEKGSLLDEFKWLQWWLTIYLYEESFIPSDTSTASSN
jgi:hypothetical protein